MNDMNMGTLSGNAFTLTNAATRACGHLLAEGDDAGDVGRALRAEVRDVAQEAADKTGKSVEIYGSAPNVHDWLVDVVEPAASELREEDGCDCGSAGDTRANHSPTCAAL